MSISIIIPVFDEADKIDDLFAGLPAEVESIVVDGGSTDSTVDRCSSRAGRVLISEKGRAMQMNAGAAVASGEILVFLHADTSLPPNFVRELERFRFSQRAWGRFDVSIDSSSVVFRIIEKMMNLRSRMTGICTGDQAIFIRRSIFQQIGGYPPIALMEDIEISKRLKRLSKPFCVAEPAVTSARRWLDGGKLQTILLMWWLRLQYFLGISPERLIRQYNK